MKKLAETAIILIFFAIASWAQESRNEVTVQGSGFFQKQTTSGGITNQPSNSGGVMAGYRFNLKNWLAVEGDYDYFRNHENLLSSNSGSFIPTRSRRDRGRDRETSFLQGTSLQGVSREDCVSIRARGRRSDVL